MRPTYERLVERDLRERTGDPTLTIPSYLLQCADQPDVDAAAFIGIPLSTYKKWKARHVERTYRLREPAATR